MRFHTVGLHFVELSQLHNQRLTLEPEEKHFKKKRWAEDRSLQQNPRDDWVTEISISLVSNPKTDRKSVCISKVYFMCKATWFCGIRVCAICLVALLLVEHQAAVLNVVCVNSASISHRGFRNGA